MTPPRSPTILLVQTPCQDRTNTLPSPTVVGVDTVLIRTSVGLDTDMILVISQLSNILYITHDYQ